MNTPSGESKKLFEVGGIMLTSSESVYVSVSFSIKASLAATCLEEGSDFSNEFGTQSLALRI